MANDLSGPPTMDEIQYAIMKMRNNKSLGFSGVTTDMLKCLPEEGIHLLS